MQISICFMLLIASLLISCRTTAPRYQDSELADAYIDNQRGGIYFQHQKGKIDFDEKEDLIAIKSSYIRDNLTDCVLKRFSSGSWIRVISFGELKGSATIILSVDVSEYIEDYAKRNDLAITCDSKYGNDLNYSLEFDDNLDIDGGSSRNEATDPKTIEKNLEAIRVLKGGFENISECLGSNEKYIYRILARANYWGEVFGFAGYTTLNLSQLPILIHYDNPTKKSNLSYNELTEQFFTRTKDNPKQHLFVPLSPLRPEINVRFSSFTYQGRQGQLILFENVRFNLQKRAGTATGQHIEVGGFTLQCKI